jgi:hypothetical protein
LKRLHFGRQTVKAGPGQIILLKKDIYVMAEYIEEGLNFEALMVFLPLIVEGTVNGKILKVYCWSDSRGQINSSQ